jgi:hypothetical protein
VNSHHQFEEMTDLSICNSKERGAAAIAEPTDEEAKGEIHCKPLVLLSLLAVVGKLLLK